MDKGLKHGKMCHVLKTQEDRRSSRQTALIKQWEFVKSDTRGLAQERAIQQQLQLSHHDQVKFIWSQKENADSLQQGDHGNEDAEEENEYLHLYDSLEVHPQDKKNPILLDSKHLGSQIEEKEEKGQLLSDDVYSDLRYDPNWRTNLKGAGRFNESPQISVKECYQNPEEPSNQWCDSRGGLVIKGGYRYIVDTSTAPVLTPHMASSESDHLYRLWPQNDQTSSATSPQCLNSSAKNQSDNNLQRGFRQMGEKSLDNVGETISITSKQTEDIQSMHVQELQTCYQKEVKHTQEGPIQTQQRSTSPLMSPKVLSNKNQRPLIENKVQHNILTLGRITPKCGSYVKAYALKQEMPHQKKVHVTLEKTASAESQTGSSAPKLSLLQKTQQLKVAKISKGKKAKQKEYSNPSQQQQNPSLRVEAEHGDCLHSQLAKSATVNQTEPQKTTSSQPLPSTVHLSIHLNTGSHLLPLLQQMGQNAIINLPSLHDHTYRTSASKSALSLAYKQTTVEKSNHVSRKGLNVHLTHQNWESGPEQWERTEELKCPSYKGEDQRWSPNEGYVNTFAQNLPRTLTSTLPQVMGTSKVLPPIGQPITGKGTEPSSGHSVNTAYPIHRSSSDGYLVQMEKQRQMRAKDTDKASCVKDYKLLKSDIKFQGLNPDCAANEKTKLKRQKLYSNVIREQNKKLSGIPFPRTKDQKDCDKKVPRMKALEYVKTIAKPPIQSRPKVKQRNQSEGITEHAPFMKGLDVSQLATLQLLRKRHEEEKQSVALFTKQHAV
ncbi:jhy protein homolog isoform X1 [Acanthochromis polyacanthus]|uniref:jhy protein homolog isoform X1 n=1 Tax=Acanthochromis polyacanthus TaxID=80966 RepID=UPI002234DF6D|nr:jhy protein homolog isoform X1 [Acanthochromis polyacanthus]